MYEKDKEARNPQLSFQNSNDDISDDDDEAFMAQVKQKLKEDVVSARSDKDSTAVEKKFSKPYYHSKQTKLSEVKPGNKRKR
ncbi:hypothetical protein D3C87_2096520 [compost metagenome]